MLEYFSLQILPRMIFDGAFQPSINQRLSVGTPWVDIIVRSRRGPNDKLFLDCFDWWMSSQDKTSNPIRTSAYKVNLTVAPRLLGNPFDRVVRIIITCVCVCVRGVRGVCVYQSTYVGLQRGDGT
jgi:hypothetical protein